MIDVPAAARGITVQSGLPTAPRNGARAK